MNEPKTITFKLPRVGLPSLQATVLVLLILVGVLQTVQLYGLNLRIGSGQVSAGTAVSASASSSPSSSVTSSLPSMVGGC